MISRDIVQKILEAGAQAPSGSNSQPWRFEVQNGAVSVFMLPEKDHLILNFRNRGTILANGALIENIVIAARHYGFEPEIAEFPDENNKNLVVRIDFREDAKNDTQVKSEPDLFDAIWKRTTNRKPFETRKIEEKAKKELLAAPSGVGTADILLKITEDRGEIEALATAASANEAVMFANRDLHKLFFEELVWTEKEEREKKSGLYMKTMELKPPQAAALHLFKKWPFMNFMNKAVGMANNIAKDNAKGYAACGLYGAVLCNNEDKDFLGLGRMIERAWLIATANGLSFQVQTGVAFLWQRIAAGGEAILSPGHTALIKEQYKKMADIFDAKEKFIPALFRIGYDGEPSARSSKKAPEIIFT